MWKSGLIGALAMLVLAGGVTLASPVCAPCIAIFIGVGAGLLAGVFARPPNASAAAKSGGAAG